LKGGHVEQTAGFSGATEEYEFMKNRVVGNRAGFGRRRAARLWWVARAGPARASSGPGSL